MCLTLCDPRYYSLLGSSVYGTSQAIILECVAIPFSRGSFQPRSQTCIVGRFFTILATREWQATPVLLSGEFHGQRSLVGYSSWNLKEWDTTEWLTHTHTHTHTQWVKFHILDYSNEIYEDICFHIVLKKFYKTDNTKYLKRQI